MSATEELVFRALASEHRRRIVDLLGDGPRTTGDLADRLRALSRYAVMQHLGVLEEAGLVLVRREGRQRFNHLNAVPLRRVYERWVGRFGDLAATGALALERHLTGEDTMGKTARTVRIENEIPLRATPERVCRALTTEQEKWYPHNYGGKRLKAIRFEERVGGQTYEDWGDGKGILYGTVTYWDPPRALGMRGQLPGGVTLDHWFEIEAAADGCVLKQSLVAFGELSDEEAEGIRSHGDLRAVEDRLRVYVETAETES
jgi:DNA-binding transcriptional ArsR family regulator